MIVIVIIIQLTDSKMVKLGLWKEKNLFLIHIREFYFDKNKNHLPAKKGIAFTIETWNKLVENIQQINTDVQE